MAHGPALSAFSDQFDPVAFFEGRTLGQAVVRNPLGGLIRRCHIETAGKPATDYEAMHFDERYTFDDSAAEDVMTWAVHRNDAGDLEASEMSVLGPMRSELDGASWRVRFKRKAKPPSERFCTMSVSAR